MASLPSAFYDDAAIAAGEIRNTTASWTTGCNLGGSCAPGLGISTDQKDLQNTLPNWTLLDQFENVRDAQIGQQIGGPGISDAGTSSGQEGTLPDSTIRLFDNPANVNGQPDNDAAAVANGSAILRVLADGWISGTPTP